MNARRTSSVLRVTGVAETAAAAHNLSMAEQKIAVEVDHSRYAAFADPGDRELRSIELTTIEAQQKRAVVRLFLVRGDSRRLLTSFDLQDLPRSTEKPLITLTAQRGRGSRMRFRIYVNRRPAGDRTVRVPRSKKPLLAAALAAAALALLLWGSTALVRSLVAPSAPAPEAPPAVTEAEEPPEEPELEPPAADEPPADEPPADEPAPEEPAPEEPAEPTEPDTVAETPAEEPTPEEPQPQPEPEPQPVSIEPQEHTVYFTADSARITSETRAALGELTDELNELLDEGAELELLRLHGHTAIAGPERGRQALSEQRAENVHELLLSLGLPVAEHELEELDIRGFGSSAPVTQDPEEQQRNRRVEIRVEMSAAAAAE